MVPRLHLAAAKAVLVMVLLLGALFFLASCTAGPGTQPPQQGERPPAPPAPATGPSAQPAPVPPPEGVGLKLVAQGFVSPVGLIPAPDDTGRLFVVDQAGTISALNPDGAVLGEPFLDLRPRMVALNPRYDERGLLGMAFHPGFKQNGRLFVYYSAPLREGGPAGWNHTSHISEFKVSASDRNRADPASERSILQVDQPQSNHNAGELVFGPDGFLYVSLGDGGAGNDVGLGHPPMGNGQDTTTLLGKILRIDVDRGDPYGIPPDNPFAGKDGADEIFAFGFRNPFRMSFDKGGSRELFVGEVGQNMWEEVDIVVKGGNYGWNLKEGTRFFDPANPGVSPQQGKNVDAAGRPLIDPIAEYPHTGAGPAGIAVIGGFVYRGATLPGLQGAYVFGDFSASGQRPEGKLFIATRPATQGMWPVRELRITGNPNGQLNAFLRALGQDASGELYVLTADVSGPSGSTGKVLKVVP